MVVFAYSCERRCKARHNLRLLLVVSHSISKSNIVFCWGGGGREQHKYGIETRADGGEMAVESEHFNHFEVECASWESNEQ